MKSVQQDTLFDPDPNGERASAYVDPSGLYRYDLTRTWTPSGDARVQWIMLNPSTADATLDDPTLRRCTAYSKAWGFDGLFVNNLFAYRSTDPAALLTANDPVGPENDEWVVKRAAQADLTVVAWGSGPKANWAPFLRRVEAVLALVESPHALRLNGDGMPAHPSRLPSALRPEPFSLGEQKMSRAGPSLGL